MSGNESWNLLFPYMLDNTFRQKMDAERQRIAGQAPGPQPGWLDNFIAGPGRVLHDGIGKAFNEFGRGVVTNLPYMAAGPGMAADPRLQS